MCELQEYYATSNSYAGNWEVNNKCCAFSVKYNQWYRAIILDPTLLNQQVKVNDFYINWSDLIDNYILLLYRMKITSKHCIAFWFEIMILIIQYVVES
jgi:hypothetical protein